MKKTLSILFALLPLLLVAVLPLAAQPDAGVPAEKAEEGYHPAESQAKGSEGRLLDSGVQPGEAVIRIPIEGTIDLGLAAFIRRVLEEHANDKLVVLDVNTLGGRVDAAIQIRDALLEFPGMTVAYVHPRAISAGALISLACKVIAIAPGGSIGAATPMMGNGEAQSDDVTEKMTSYMRTEMRATAEANGRRGDLAEAMVDRDVVIDGIVQSGKLLTLDTAGALKYGIADFQASSLAEVFERLGAEDGRRLNTEETWAEKLARFLTDPTVSGLLMSLGMLGIMVELYSPGLGLPGAVGALCLLAFFFGHAVANLAGIEELVLFAAGVVLMALEVFVIPGFGVAGVLGLVCLFLSLVFMLFDTPLDVSMESGVLLTAVERVSISFLVTLGLTFLVLRFVPRTAAGRKLVLGMPTGVQEGYISAHVESDLLGEEGEAITPLRPSGKARLGGKPVDVVTQGDFIDRGETVRVIEVRAARVVVERKV